MDLLYTGAIVVCVLVFMLGILYLKKKNFFTSNDIKFISEFLDLSLNILDELDLKQEPEIKKVGLVVSTAINTAYEISAENINNEQLIIKANQLVIKYANQFELELTEDRKTLILKLIEMTIKSKRETSE